MDRIEHTDTPERTATGSAQPKWATLLGARLDSWPSTPASSTGSPSTGTSDSGEALGLLPVASGVGIAFCVVGGALGELFGRQWVLVGSAICALASSIGFYYATAAGPEGDRYGTDVLVTGREPGWPAPTPEAVDWMHERGVACLGTDGLSIGPAANGAPTHLAGLARNMAFIEALTGLRAMPPRGAWFLFLPIRLVDGTGGPGRAIAVLPTRTRPDKEA